MHEVLDVRANATAQAKDRLDQQRWLHEAAIEEVCGRVEMANVVALDLEPRLVLAARLKDVRDVFECIFEDTVVASFEIGTLPIVLEFLEAPEQLVQPKVHGPHVQRSYFRPQLQRRLQPLLNGHRRCPACGNVDHHVRRLFDEWYELAEQFWILRRTSVLRIARVEMNDRSPSLSRADRGLGNLIRCHRQIA